MGDLPDSRLYYVDLERCTGCYACVIACKDRSNLPDPLDWIRVERQESGSCPEVRLVYRVVHCFHCASPSCLEACPTAAIRSVAGWVQIDAALCTGCGACVAACPFSAIVLGADGLASKCDGCADQVSAGDAPTCVRACPMRALFFTSPHEVQRPRSADSDWDDHDIGPRVWYAVRARGTEARDG